MTLCEFRGQSCLIPGARFPSTTSACAVYLGGGSEGELRWKQVEVTVSLYSLLGSSLLFLAYWGSLLIGSDESLGIACGSFCSNTAIALDLS